MGMFDKPQTIEAPATKKAASKKEEVALSGVEHLAMIDALQKTLETLRATLEADVKTVALDRFMAHIAATGQRPESFRGTEGGASALLSLGRKSSSTALTEAAIDLLRANGIEPEKKVTTPELFGINPAYSADKDLLGKVEKALAKIVPADFIILQAEQSKLVATEEMLLDAIGRRLPVEVISIMTSLSCSPKLAVTDIGKILEFVGGLVAAPTFAQPAVVAEEKPAPKKLKVVKSA